MIPRNIQSVFESLVYIFLMRVYLLIMHLLAQEHISEMDVNDGEQPGTSGVPPYISGVLIPPKHINPCKKTLNQ